MFGEQLINGTINKSLYLTQSETQTKAPAGELSLKQLLLCIPKISLLHIFRSEAMDT